MFIGIYTTPYSYFYWVMFKYLGVLIKYSENKIAQNLYREKNKKRQLVVAIYLTTGIGIEVFC